MRLRLLLAVLVMVLAPSIGCARIADVIYKTQTVEVPVTKLIYCRPRLPAPVAPLPVSRLTAASSASDTVRAYAESVVTLRAGVAERDRALQTCRGPDPGP